MGNRHKTNKETTSRPLLEEHVARCAWCEKEFELWTASQLGAINAGRNVYCSRQCNSAYDYRKNAGRYTLGPCETCGRMFPSRTKKHKKYCSQECYLRDPKTFDRLRRMNEEKKKPPHACPQCGKVFQHKSNKYCSNLCRRKFFAERFDRWIANPQKIALPQNFDEFLTATELPCLIDGCNWIGRHLGHHVNVVHGIPAKEFRKLAGFNKKTGLVTPDISEALSARPHMAAFNEAGRKALEEMGYDKPPAEKGRKPTLEALEHLRKARALIHAEHETNKRYLPCRRCKKDVEQPAMGLKLYCSTYCRSQWYEHTNGAELACDFCGEAFQAKMNQVRRARQGLKVCCSMECRNRMNMVACLAARGIDYKP